jgi:2,4-dienoyl-CoA reductase-like NADH-dependent reductase (Old Yellow Enzyme family)/pyruvate/2-oxoglutarate dehydrogenase complex dihydrolipoamide dehydrogenase (E3) component
MAEPFPHLFAPLALRYKTLKSRLVFGAHTANMAEGGLPSERHRGYYEERARGGAAMIVVEPMPVHATAVLTRGNFRHSADAVIPAFRRITESCHAHDVVMIQQLYHVGQHGDHDNSFEPNWSPSGLPSYHDSDGSHAMTDTEIEAVIEGFAEAARRAHAGGFDGVELFAAYHALIDQFWTPWSNRRDDRWGGSFANRMRFSSEIIERIRRRTGQDFIIGMAVSMHPAVEVSLSIEAMQEIAVWHDERGLVDYITCGTGSYFDFYPLMPTVLYDDNLGAPYAAALKQVVSHARVQCESHIRTAENAEQVIASGQADLVSIVRGQIADPHLGNKARQGRAEDIRPCLSCNEMCWGRRYRDYWISCLVNPSAGREFEWGGDGCEPSDNPKRVLVVGGGPAGLEAARVAAERGHRVTLAEAAPELGGRLRLAGLQPRRGQILDLIRWWETQLARHDVEVRLNTWMELEDVTAFGADVVVLATGSLPAATGFQRALPHVERLPGVDAANVWSVEDVLARRARPGKRVVVLDDIGHWHGAGTAWHLAEQGHAVTIVTRFPMVAFELIRTATDWPLRRKLKALGVASMHDAAVTAWDGDGADVIDLRDGATQWVAADALVLATVNIAQTKLHEALADSGREVHSIGDCVAPRLAVMAIYEGRELAMQL